MRADGACETEILALVSHELRAPISVIIGLVNTLRDRRHLLSEEEVDDSLDRLSRQARRAAELVNDLLDISQLESGRFRVTLEHVYLAHAVKLALEAVPAPAAKAVHLAIPEDVAVIADPTRLAQVIVNLLTNAYRYGGGTIRVEAHRTADGVLTTVFDDGDGLPQELLPALFEKFSRGANATGPLSTGLGLAIVRALVNAFGGRVWYESDPAGGARFLLLLRDAGRAYDDSDTGGEHAGRGNTVTKILIVDDEPDIRFLLRMTFQSAGHEVIEAHHGAAALERVAGTRPDLVVTDMMMPVMDGQGLIERLRSDPDTATIPILVVSSHAATATGADVVVDKAAFRASEMLDIAASLLGGRG